ncbi:MAG: phosphatase PAP2 family protein [Pseudomonadota bacterium]
MSNSSSFNIFIKVVTHPVFIICWLSLIVVSYFFFDEKIAIFLHTSLNQRIYQAAGDITVLGLGGYYIIAFGLLFVIGKFILKRSQFAYKSLYLFANVLVSGGLCDLIKFLCGRARPELLFNQHLYGFYFFKTHYAFISFPSGHATTINAIMLGLSFIKPRFWLLFMTIALLVTLSRVFLTAHYLSDVMTGAFLGFGVAIFMCHVFKYYHLVDEF